MFSQKAFGARLEFLRSKTKFSLFQIPNEIGVESSGYLQYEMGARIPQEEVLNAICDYYDVSAEWLLVGIPLNDKERQLSEELEKENAEAIENLRKLGIYD